jgi:3-oxoacyl-[acyl-carrier protein] reductase
MDKVVIVTGSSRGIGLATAERFLADGDNVIIFCRHHEHVKEAVADLEKRYDAEKIFGTFGDVRDSDDVAEIIEEVIDHYGKIDVIVNNAGIGLHAEITDTSIAQIEDVLDTNLKGPIYFCHYGLMQMKRQNSGVIVNVSSGLGAQGEAGFSIYSATKFGLIGLTQSLADEFSQTPIKIYAVLPGGTDTLLYHEVLPETPVTQLMRPEYVAKRIFEVAKGVTESGSEIEIRKGGE